MFNVALPFGAHTPQARRIPYRTALAAVDICPDETVTTLAGMDGLVLAGGSDIDPDFYHAPTRHTETGETDPDRDRREKALVLEALDRDLPVLAICRGQQLLNVALGGTLIQHIEGHRRPGEPDAHRISISSPSKLRSILGADEYSVNSRHHQCVDRLASALVAVARAHDDVIEALEFPGKAFVLAVHWHPEDRPGGADARLFVAFRDALKLAAER